MRARWRTSVRTTGAAVALGLALAACSAADEVSQGEDSAATESGSSIGGAAREEAATDSEASGATGVDAAAIAVGAPTNRKVIFDASLSLEADDPAATVEDIRRAVERAGGFVANADLHRSGDRDLLSGSMTLRVPAAELSSTLQALKGLAARVVDEGIDSSDVTEQYADIEAQLRNLRALETELLALLADIRERSNDATQVLTVFERIRQNRSEIEQLQGRKNVLDDLVSLSTITVAIRPTPSAAPIASGEWRPGEVVRDAARTTVSGLQSLADLGIRLVVTVLPLLVLLVGLPVALALGLRRVWRRYNARPSGPSPVS